MTVYYEGSDITDSVLIRSCAVRDTAAGRCDSLEIVFEDAAKWFRWGPKEDDRITVGHDGYTSGRMYVHTIIPEDGRFRIIASSLPSPARRKEYRSYTGKTLYEIMNSCALNTGMDKAAYGVETGYVIPYTEQDDESAAAFLHRLLMYEGSKLKCVQGRLAAIGILWAQKRDPARIMNITSSRTGIVYQNSGSRRLRSLMAATPYGTGIATDMGAAATCPSLTVCGLPARNTAQAGRWARGLLLKHNRETEKITVETVFDPVMTAMARVDIVGGTDMDGQWLVEEAEHDLIDKTTKTTMYRTVTGII